MALKKYHERGGSANAAAQGFVGIYSPEDRKSRIMRFLEKRKRRMWTKKVKYDVRKVSLEPVLQSLFFFLACDAQNDRTLLLLCGQTFANV